MKKACNVPSEADWGDYGSDEDARYSYSKFFGRSIDEAKQRFENNVLEACDELRFMPETPFRYYILAFRNVVVSEKLLSNGNPADAASCFLDLILDKLTDSPHTILPILGELMPAVAYVSSNQKLFDADIDIYGDFLEKAESIEGHLRAAEQQ